MEKTLESPLECKEIKPVNSKGYQPWIFTESVAVKRKKAEWVFMSSFPENKEYKENSEQAWTFFFSLMPPNSEGNCSLFCRLTWQKLDFGTSFLCCGGGGCSVTQFCLTLFNPWTATCQASLWRTGKPDMSQSTGLHRVGHDLVSYQQQYAHTAQLVLKYIIQWNF